MKTVFSFTVSWDKRKVILIHDKDVKIFKEFRIDPYFTDSKGNPIEKNYIVICYPKTKKIDLSKWKRTYDDRYSIGYVINDLGDEIELQFYNNIYFAWKLYELEKTGLFKKVRQRIIPQWKEKGELFPCYIDARGLREWAFNLVFGTLQLPFMLYKDIKNSLKEKKSDESNRLSQR